MDNVYETFGCFDSDCLSVIAVNEKNLHLWFVEASARLLNSKIELIPCTVVAVGWLLVNR